MSTSDFAQKSIEAQPTSVIEEAVTAEGDSLFEAALVAAKGAAPTVESPPVATAPAESAPATPEVSAPPADNAKSTERIAPTLLKLMEREAAVVERENRLKAAEAELATIRQHAGEIEIAQKKFQYDPISYIRKLAPDANLADLAKQLWYDQLGESAPPEYRATREARSAKGSIEELRADMEQKLQQERQRWTEETQQQQAEAAYSQYVGALGAFTKEVPTEYPLVQAFATSNPERVHRGLLKIAQKHAQATNGEVLTPAQCADKLNKELEGLRSALGVTTTTPAVAPPVVKNATTPVSTIRNKHTSVQPNRALPTADDDEAKFQLAFEAARAVAANQQ